MYIILAKVAYSVPWRAKSRNISVHIENASLKKLIAVGEGFLAPE
jgi:hypothetical protein